jgi:hypothetical protein
MNKTKRLSITVPLEIYAELVGIVKERVTSHQLEQAAKQRMEQQMREAQNA